MGVFETLITVNVNEHKEEKNGFNYLTWSWAWDEIKKQCPDVTYTIWKNADGLPFAYDEKTGYMVYTSVTIEGVTHEMWLPVMDGKNKAMKAQPYTYKTKEYGKEVEKSVAAATMTDINKTIMRCLVKNLAMFGLGLYIYAGEDLPEGETEQEKPQQSNEYDRAVEEAKAKTRVMGYLNRHNFSKEEIDKLCKFYHVETIQDLTLEHCNSYIKQIEMRGGNIDE